VAEEARRTEHGRLPSFDSHSCILRPECLPIKVISIPLGFCLAILASAWATGQSNPGNPQDGKAVYEKECMRCHGKKLDGTGTRRGP
jgi:hypothetical protein